MIKTSSNGTSKLRTKPGQVSLCSTQPNTLCIYLHIQCSLKWHLTVSTMHYVAVICELTFRILDFFLS